MSRALLAYCRDLRDARSVLLRTEYVDGKGWQTRKQEPQRIDGLQPVPAALPASSSAAHGEPLFLEHVTFTLPTAEQTVLHRFSLNPKSHLREKMHARLATEARILSVGTLRSLRAHSVARLLSRSLTRALSLALSRARSLTRAL